METMKMVPLSRNVKSSKWLYDFCKKNLIRCVQSAFCSAERKLIEMKKKFFFQIILCSIVHFHMFLSESEK